MLIFLGPVLRVFTFSLQGSINQLINQNTFILRHVLQTNIVYGLTVWLCFPCWCSAQHCCSSTYGYIADDISCMSPNKIAKYCNQNVHPGTVDTARMLLELIFIRYVSFPGKFAVFWGWCTVFNFSSFLQVVLLFFHFYCASCTKL